VSGGGLERRIADELAALSQHGLRRALQPPTGIDFASSDYLGLAAEPAFGAAVVRRLAALAEAGTPLFTPSARLLRGESQLHARFETRLAAWKGAERALLVPSGWQANAALVGALVGPGDRVLSDELNHASLIDALRLSRAERIIVPHLDLDSYRRELERPNPGGETFVVVEALYSMEGDLAPLAELAEVAARHGAALIVDEAHASGLYGARGSGWIEACGAADGVFAAVTTFGKALAVQGAAITGSRSLVDLVLQRGRAFVFTTAISPLLVVAAGVALDLVVSQPERRRRLHVASRRFRERLAGAGLPIETSDSPIVPVLVGDSAEAVAVASRLQRRGFDVRAIRPPTVPEGTARLRISIHADRTAAEIDALAEAVVEELA